MSTSPPTRTPEDEPVDEPPSPYLRLPWPLVAAGLAVFLAVIFGAGLYANRYLRPTLAPVPAAVTELAAPAVTPRVTPAPAVTPAVTPVVTPVGAPGAVVTPAVTPAPVVTPAVTPVVTVALAVTAGVTPVPSALPTVEPALAEEVGEAYETFWRVRTDAALQLETAHLAEVMDGEYLVMFQQRIAQLRAEDHAVNTQVALNYTVVQSLDGFAVVHDRIEDHSFYVNAETGEPLAKPTNDVLLIEFTLRRVNGTWKVVRSVLAS